MNSEMMAILRMEMAEARTEKLKMNGNEQIYSQLNELRYEEMALEIAVNSETMEIMKMEMAETQIVKLKINGNEWNIIRVNVI